MEAVFNERYWNAWESAEKSHMVDAQGKKVYHNDERLQKSGLTTPETRRLRGDLIEMFKIFKSFDYINYQKISLSRTELRGHNFKLYKP